MARSNRRPLTKSSPDSGSAVTASDPAQDPAVPPSAPGKKQRAADARAARLEAARAITRRDRRRKQLMTTAVAAVAVLLLGGVATLAVRSARTTAQDSTTPAAFDLPALHGNERIRLAAFHGEPTVVNFFASWCTACDAELPGFAAVSQQLRGRVNFVGVNALETGDRDVMVDRHGIGWWPLAHDVGGANGSGLHDALGGGNSMPLTAFYSADGTLLAVERTALPEEALRAELARLYGITM